ncbi:MAG: SRPBCC family protein [Anaerolineales bacterium]|nr:SRPBCC family protein [Anaerolineales bacterium]
MPKFSTSININASQEAIWKVLSNVAHWHEWTPTVTKVEVFNTPELNLGNRYKVFQPKIQPAEWTVTELSASNFTWESKSAGMHMVAEHIVKSVNADQAEVTLTFAFNGWLGNLIGKMYGKLTQDYIQTEAQSLKKKVENK